MSPHLVNMALSSSIVPAVRCAALITGERTATPSL
jgi:hypothetical protein